jgi:hypothetical protein
VDWFLAAHQVAPLQFEMGGLWAPISVRDQMVRGQELVRRAVVEGLVGPGRALIVVGAGAGGMAAAVAADKAGVGVIVIERGTRPFARQVGITARTIHPYVYDWPLDRYQDTVLLPPAVLPWKEATADRAARQWIAALAGHRLVAFGSSVSPPLFPLGAPAIAVHGGMVNVHVSTPAGTGWLHGGMVLSSVGFGSEITSIQAALGSTYHGWTFWQNDTLISHNLGAAGAPDVVIAGGGDGALQDMVRALLDPSVRDVRDLLAALPPITDDIRARVLDADDTATRTWLWGTSKEDDCPILDKLHKRVESAADDWWRTNAVQIRTSLTPLWRTDVASVRLVHSCTHFGRSYALNRFLAFVLERAAPEHRFDRTSGYRLTSVDGGHSCRATAPCWGRHDAKFTANTCAATLTGTTSFGADLIILRGGVDPPKTFLTSSSLANRRQYLPDRPR